MARHEQLRRRSGGNAGHYRRSARTGNRGAGRPGVELRRPRAADARSAGGRKLLRSDPNVAAGQLTRRLSAGVRAHPHLDVDRRVRQRSDRFPKDRSGRRGSPRTDLQRSAAGGADEWRQHRAGMHQPAAAGRKQHLLDRQLRRGDDRFHGNDRRGELPRRRLSAAHGVLLEGGRRVRQRSRILHRHSHRGQHATRAHRHRAGGPDRRSGAGRNRARSRSRPLHRHRRLFGQHHGDFPGRSDAAGLRLRAQPRLDGGGRLRQRRHRNADHYRTGRLRLPQHQRSRLRRDARRLRSDERLDHGERDRRTGRVPVRAAARAGRSGRQCVHQPAAGRLSAGDQSAERRRLRREVLLHHRRRLQRLAGTDHRAAGSGQSDRIPRRH